MDKPPLPPIRSQQTQVVQASNHYYRSDSPQPFSGNISRPKTGHPSNGNSNGSPGASTRRRLPKLAGPGVIVGAVPPLFIGTTINQPTLPKVGEEESNEVASFPEEAPVSIKDYTDNTDTLEDNDEFIQGEEVPQISEEHLEICKDLESETLNEEVTQEKEIDHVKDYTTATEEETSIQNENDEEEDNGDKESQGTLVDEVINSQPISTIDTEDTMAAYVNNKTEDNDGKPQDDTNVEVDNNINHDQCEDIQINDDCLDENKVPIDDDDDNDVVSPHEVSREPSAQSARSGKNTYNTYVSPIGTSPRVASQLASATIKSPNKQMSRPTSHLSVAQSPRIPSATATDGGASVIKSPISASPKTAISLSRKSSARESDASSRPTSTKLGIHSEEF